MKNIITEEDEIIKLADISKTYKEGYLWNNLSVKALKNINLSIRRGENFGLVGESGSGKTTLIKIITKILRPSSGDIYLYGLNLSRVKRKELSKIIQVVFQDASSSLDPMMKIKKILAEPLYVNGLYKKINIKSVIAKIIEDVGLDVSAVEKRPYEISGGQRQRVCIARALISSPDLIIFDEAFSSSDFINNHQIIVLLKEIQSKRKVSYFFIDHDLRFVKNICDIIGVMYNGKIVDMGQTKELFKNQNHYYSKKLFSSLSQ